MAEAELIQVVTTLPAEGQARELARALVEEGLAACAKVAGPVTSVYHWEGKVEEAQEWVCVVTTLAVNFEVVKEAIRRRHPYQVPEILALPVSAVSEGYADWVREVVRANGPA